MKISINSTYSYIRTNINYGSTLQCYALQKYLKKRGHDPEHLRDYRANPVLILKRLKNIKYFKPFCAKAVAQFEMGRFIKENIAVSTKGYISEKAMYKNCPKADCFIAGSDQIWRNPTGSRFLNYAPDEAIKLSYAASFGRTSLPKEIAEKIKPWLSRFDGISVREKTAVTMVESIVDKEVVQVLDPTLLLDMGEYPYANIEEKNYCYCYFLNLGDKKNVSFDEIKRYAADENMKLIVTSPSNYTLFLNENPIFPTVEKWLGLYKNANCIFTNTYHGMLFCIIFKKQFLFFVQKGSGAAENDRFYGGKSCMAGFVLKNTLSDNGGVTRGICKMDDQNNLTEVVETKNIVKTATGAETDGVAVDVNSLVSMNMWGLTPEFLDVLEDGFKEFFKKEVPGNPLKAEYLIPIFIGELLEQGKMSVKVLRTNDTWYGMTYHEDVAAVKDSFKKMLENGVYKADLFSDL